MNNIQNDNIGNATETTETTETNTTSNTGDTIYYVNSYMPSAAVFNEYATVLHAKWKNIVAWLGIAVFVVCGLTAGQGGYYSYLVVSAVGIAACAMLMYSPKMRAKMLLQTATELGGGKLCQNTASFGENIHLQEGELDAMVEYGEITDVKQSKNLIVLMLGRYDAVILAKNGFTTGDEAQFISFLQQKCAEAVKA